MKIQRCIIKPFKFLCTFGFFAMSLYMTTAHAQLIDTETLVDSAKSEQTRNQLQNALNRDEVKTKMHELGVEPEIIQSRVDSLTDAEIQALASDINALPAGGRTDTVVVLLLIIIIILLI